MSHRTRSVELRARLASGGWERRAYGPGETVPLGAVACELRVDEVYLGLSIT